MLLSCSWVWWYRWCGGYWRSWAPFLLVYTIFIVQNAAVVVHVVLLVVGAGTVLFVPVVTRNTLRIIGFPFLVAGLTSLPIFGAAWAPVKSKEQDDGLLYAGGFFVGGGGGVHTMRTSCPFLLLLTFPHYINITAAFHPSTIATYRSSAYWCEQSHIILCNWGCYRSLPSCTWNGHVPCSL